jgi:hypothetical protein
MRRSHLARVGHVFSLLAVGAFFAGPAAAHISLDQGGTQKSRYGDGFLKDGPCGKAGGTRSQNVYTYAAGQTVPVAIVEFIPHPSYFRIAFDDDGDDDFVSPASIDPVDSSRPCPYNAADKCGAADYYNSPTVLPMMDDLNPHKSAPLGQMYSWDVKMPDVGCDNCTLQIIQVMEDTVHGAYNPVKGDPNDNPYTADIYFQCIDLVLQKPDSGSDAPPATKPASKDDSSSGCSVTSRGASNGAATALGFFALSCLAVRRRRASLD